jgi:hypothetical protein
VINRIFTVLLLPIACSPVKGTPLIDAPDLTLESLSVTPGSASIERAFGSAEQLSVMATLADGATMDVTPLVTWASSDPTIASVDRVGSVSATGAGTATITATYREVAGSAQVTTFDPTLVVNSASPIGVNFYDAFANGDVAPLRTISGSNAFAVATELWGISVAGNELFVTALITNTIYVFPADGSGDIAPLRTISGSNTGLDSPYGLFVSNGEIYVVNGDPTVANDSIAVFPAEGSGNIAPTRVIAGTATLLSQPVGISVADNEIYIANQIGGLVEVFPAEGSGNIAPTRTIGGAQTLLTNAVDIRVMNGELYVANWINSTLLVFPQNGSGDILPLRALSGSDTALLRPFSLGLVGEQIVVANNGAQVCSLDAQGQGDQSTVSQITGSNTELVSPTSLFAY